MNTHTTRVRHLPEQVINQLLAWCEENASQQAAAVLAIGLSYLYGLNQHQIAAAEFTDERGEAISYPLARRRRELADARRTAISITEPQWLRDAAAQLGRGPGLVYKPRRRTGTISGNRISLLVTAAGIEATGLRGISCTTLASSRVAAVVEENLPLALHDLGYASSYVARLVNPQLSLIIPRKAA